MKFIIFFNNYAKTIKHESQLRNTFFVFNEDGGDENNV